MFVQRSNQQCILSTVNYVGIFSLNSFLHGFLSPKSHLQTTACGQMQHVPISSRIFKWFLVVFSRNRNARQIDLIALRKHQSQSHVCICKTFDNKDQPTRIADITYNGYCMLVVSEEKKYMCQTQATQQSEIWIYVTCAWWTSHTAAIKLILQTKNPECAEIFKRRKSILIETKMKSNTGAKKLRVRDLYCTV